jgi:hypothetical protein
VFVLSGRGLCEGPISRPEESYRLWCVSECDQVKINNVDTCCEQVEEGRTAKLKDSFSTPQKCNLQLLITGSNLQWSWSVFTFRPSITKLGRFCCLVRSHPQQPAWHNLHNAFSTPLFT